MKSFFKSALGGQKDPNSLVGKLIQCSQFQVICEEAIGAGGYASIYRVKDQPTQQVYALKHLRLPHDSDAVADVRHEMRVMHLLGSHPNVLKLYAASFAGPAGKETDAFMVMDYCPITLLDMMQRSNFQLDDFFVHEVFSEVCHAVAHMHTFSPPYAHRDIKAENVLKTAKGKWVLCDFGSSTTKAQVFETPAEIAMEEDVIRRTTTPAYRAPEMWDLMSRQRIDTKVDIWALGVLLYVLVFGKLPFQGDSKLSVLFGKYEMPPGKPQLVCDLIRDMLTTDPALRPDIMSVIGRLDAIKHALHSLIPGAPPVAAAPAPAPAPPVTQPAPAPSPPTGNLLPGFGAPAAAGPLATAALQAPGGKLAQLQQPINHHGPPPTSGGMAPAGAPNGLQRSSPVNAQHVQQLASGSMAVPPGRYPPVPGAQAAAPQPPPGQAGTSPALRHAAPTPVLSNSPSPPLIPPASSGPSVTKQPPPAVQPQQQANGALAARHATHMAASTPLFAPVEGALQLASALSSTNSFTQLTSTVVSQLPQLQPTEPPTTTLIDVDPGPAGEATKSLLGEDAFVPPPKKHGGGHRHHRSSSFSKEFLGGAAGGFEPDWGDQPAFGGGPSASAGAHQSRMAPAGSSTAHGPKQGAHASPPPHMHHASQPVGLPSRMSDTGTPAGPRSPRLGARALPSQSRNVSTRAPDTTPSTDGSPGLQGPAAPAVAPMDMDSLRVQVKGLTSTQASMLSRIKHLEDLVQEQAALIRQLMQRDQGGAGAGAGPEGQEAGGRGGGSKGPGSGAGAQSQPRRRPSSPGSAPAPAAWHAFESDGAGPHQAT